MKLPILLLGGLSVLAIAACADEDARRPGSGPPAELPGDTDATLPAVVFLGDSLTAGRGLDREQAYPALLAPRLRELGFASVDAGRSGDTTRGGMARLDGLFHRDVAVLVVALGGNDMLRGVPLEETERNLRDIVAQARAQEPPPRVILAGMRALPNLGAEYVEAFDAIYPRLAEQLDLPFVPFLLEGVGGEPEYNQDDQIHPNREGQAILAETVWATLGDAVRGRTATGPAPPGAPNDTTKRMR